MVVALGITWILDGLEVTLAGAVSGALKDSPVLQFTNTDVGIAASAYVAGAVLGALFFGWLTDRLGRKKLFFITLAVYLVATAATAFTWNLWSFCVCRFVTGAGIGGEYTAINSTIQELIPARYRGWTDLVINGSFWVGAAIGAVGSIVLLDPAVLGGDLGWRAAFLIGAVLGLVVFLMRMWIPESPRWLMTHGRVAEAEAIVAGIESDFRRRETVIPATRVAAHPAARALAYAAVGGRAHAVPRSAPAHRGRPHADGVAGVLLQRDLLHLCAGADRFLRHPLPIRSAGTSCRSRPAISSGRCSSAGLFDTVGRRPMIAATYAMSGVLLAIAGYLFAIGVLSAVQQTVAWMVIFFFASAAASSAYLTVSETFPLEVRALAIAFFYAVGTGIGGVAGPWLFGLLIDTGSRWSVVRRLPVRRRADDRRRGRRLALRRCRRAQAARSGLPPAGGGRLSASPAPLLVRPIRVLIPAVE